LVLSALSFGSHLLTDAQLSGWRLYLFWPFSQRGYIFSSAVGLDAPINYWLVYLTPVAIIILAICYQRTPLDIFSPKLDNLIVAFFQKKEFFCATCNRACNQRCDDCGKPVCIHHTTVKKSFHLWCGLCKEQNGIKAKSAMECDS